MFCLLRPKKGICVSSPPTIRKSYIGEAALSHFTKTGPVSLPIFSGVIILTEHTMGLPNRNMGRKNVSCIGTNSYLHGDRCKWQTNEGSTKKTKKNCSGDHLGSKCCVGVYVWVKTASSPVQQHNELPIQHRKPVTVKSPQAMACWQW